MNKFAQYSMDTCSLFNQWTSSRCLNALNDYFIDYSFVHSFIAPPAGGACV